MNTLILIVVTLFVYCECQKNYESPYNPAVDRDVDTLKLNEWQRYINFQKKKLKENLSNKNKGKKGKQSRKTQQEKNKVAPNFILSRTQNGFVVKQLERGSETGGSGGFEFPLQPALLTNVKYKYDGSVAPVVKLSETGKGVVSKRLEYGFAQNPGINWKSRVGSSQQVLKALKNTDINKDGEVNKQAGINSKFPDGSISLRGTLRIFNESKSLGDNELKPIEALGSDDNYEMDNEQSSEEADSFETQDTYYAYNSDEYEEEDDGNEDDGNWNDYK